MTKSERCQPRVKRVSRYSFLALASLIVMGVIPVHAESKGMVTLASPHSVADTADRLEQALNSKDMAVFARIDHAKGAHNAGLELPPTTQLIFGNPKIGTPLMQCERRVAIDLPQKMLIFEDASGQVHVAYNDPAYIRDRHQVAGCDAVFDKVSGALANFAKAATAP